MTLSRLLIVCLGLVQMYLGAIVVLTTSTLNRLMVVELSLPALLPGLLAGLHYAVQMSRPTWGYRSDTGGNRTRFIVAGMVALALCGFHAALGFVLMEGNFAAGLAVSIAAYVLRPRRNPSPCPSAKGWQKYGPNPVRATSPCSSFCR